ncbi:MAG: hypothetical protein LC664_02630 [Flavobacteriales bacterium]|nr:hypothetical protein [Flavobacteriales bacterium]
MKFFKKIGLSVLVWVSFALTAMSQPCDNGISTNPYNPVNNQFVPLANQWYPGNGTDTHNPWLNQWSWYWSDGNPTIYRNNLNWDHPWEGDAPIVDMAHPYDAIMPEGFEYLRPAGVHPDFYDYRWEDGWELLWMNMGYYPDGHPINDPATGSYYDNHNWDYEPLPSNAPYFAIYNRYRGILRLFANVWYSAESTFEDIDVVLRFTTASSAPNNNLTGLLRHASAYDRALSEPTEIKAIHAPRFHAPDLTQWIVADFQMGYDPCSCMSTGELIFDFNAFSTLDVDILRRTVALDVPINDNTYTTRDFLNMSEVNVGEYVPGTEIYQNMDRLAVQFEKKQLEYLEELETYNQSSPFALALQKFGVKQAAKFLSGGLSDIIISDSLLTWVENDNWQEATSLEGLTPAVEPQTVKNKFAKKAKGLIGETFGFLATELFSPTISKPSPPAVPVATLEESVYKGTIVNSSTRTSAPLVIPGSIPQAWEPATSLSPHRLPVYNEVLGQVAMLNTPSPLIHFSNPFMVAVTQDYDTYNPYQPFDYLCRSEETWSSEVKFDIRFDEELEIALNQSLDFDMDHTSTRVMLEVTLSNGVPETFNELVNSYEMEQILGNLMLESETRSSSGRKYTYKSEWVLLENLNQMVFSLGLESLAEITRYGLLEWDPDDPYCIPPSPSLLANNPNFEAALMQLDVQKIVIKTAHDLYFDQIGSSDVQVNTLQVNTYQLYDQADGINYFDDEPNTWSAAPAVGTFDQYISGLITIGDEDITLSHPYVSEVVGNEIFINAQKVLITGELEVPGGYSLVIQALEEIKMAPAVSSLNPKIHMRIKKDFYDTPVFEYADNAEVYSKAYKYPRKGIHLLRYTQTQRAIHLPFKARATA